MGIDPLSAEGKVCSLDCTYCQLGRTTHFSRERQIYVPTENIIKEIDALPSMEIDYLTFSGNGEPTLAKNLGEMIAALRKRRKEKIAVITNSTLIDQPDVQADLSQADFVLAKLAAGHQKIFQSINRPMEGISLVRIHEGIKNFKKNFKGKLALQIMFISVNKDYAEQIAALARDISPDEIEINTPLRPSPEKFLSKEELDGIKQAFRDLPAKTVYELKRKDVNPLSEEDTVKRHGQYKSSS